MKAFLKLVNALAVPIGLITGFGGVVAEIWLAILGEWGLIGYGVLTLACGHFGLGMAMMPGMLFAASQTLIYNFRP